VFDLLRKYAVSGAVTEMGIASGARGPAEPEAPSEGDAGRV